MTDRYAVIGHPIAHSKSPRIHRLFAEQTTQDMSYDAVLAPLDGFAATLEDLRSEKDALRGANVTVPFKEAAFALAASTTPRAQQAGAVNTLSWTATGWLGDNTDGAGLLRDLTQNLGAPLAGQRILLLGAGGAARGVLGPLLEARPSSLHIANRTPEKAQALAQLMADDRLTGSGFDGLRAAPPFDLILNATSASLAGDLPPVPRGAFHADTWAYDMMYGREPTVFLRQAKDYGAQHLADGLGMLVEQAAEAFALWRGVRPDTGPVLATLRAELAAG